MNTDTVTETVSRPMDVLADWANDTACPLDEANRRAETYAALCDLVEAVGGVWPLVTEAVTGPDTLLRRDGIARRDRLAAAAAKFGGAT